MKTNNKLEVLLEKLNYELLQGSLETEITGIANDSNKISEGSLFFCIQGAKVDGHDFIESVVKRGAKVLIVSKNIKVDGDVTVIKVNDTRYAMAWISAAFFDYPAEKLTTIGITGTKGKTTTTYLIKNMLEHMGKKVGLIGTIEIAYGEVAIHAGTTTPESLALQQYFADMVEAGMEVVVMEVSSQALMLHRTQGFRFDYGMFTNIEPDHIGPTEHSSFEHYLKCKKLLFQQCNIGIVNGDDSHIEEILKGHSCKIERYGFQAQNDVIASDAKFIKEPGKLGMEFKVSGSIEFTASITTPGKFSIYNALAAICICKHFEGITEDVIIKLKEALKVAKVKGRIEMVPVSDDFTLLIDYAHNAMSLESLLSTLKEYQPNRLVCLFGCGGNRSKSRRLEMGKVSGRLADLTIITSDNPRFEEPQSIIDDIKLGISSTRGEYVEICDRKEAIRYAITHGQRGDIVILAGKGHEDYQEIEGVKYPMDERDLIADILRESN